MRDQRNQQLRYLALLTLTGFLIGARACPLLGQAETVSATAASSASSLADTETTSAQPTTSDLNPEHIPTTGPTRLQAENVSFQVIDGVRISVKSVDGLMIPTHANRPVSLDIPTSMRVQVLSAQTSISAEALNRLLNNYTLPHAQSSVRDLKIDFEDGRVHVEGKVKKVLDIPFSAEATVDLTSAGDIRVHFTNFTAAGFVHKRLLDWLGIHVDSVAKPGRSHSFQVVDDDMIFPMHTLFPPPHFIGRLRSAKIEGDQFVQVFGDPKPFAPAPLPSDHYIYFRGGVMQCGRMTMQGVDLELVNKDEGEPLIFSIDHNFEQILPGRLKVTPTHGMVRVHRQLSRGCCYRKRIGSALEIDVP